MTADVTRRTWAPPSTAVIRASQRAQREARSIEALRGLLQELVDAAAANPTEPPDAQRIARARALLATT